ncbi:MAG: virulence RhuM family protein, partial [Bacilli bacterium]|nr:virulence RhuM family protein [Bacilli bacterium]
MKNEIILFENQDVKLEVNIKDETVWLTQKQMAELFGKDRKTITSHIKNIYRDNELNKNEVCSFFEHTASDGKKYKTQYYNLDMIISVGYRVNSKQGIIFRKWATGVLKEYLINGYAVNKKRLEYLEKTVKLIDIANRIDTELKESESREIIKVISEYSNALNLLDDYDYKRINKPKGITNDKIITYKECIDVINKLKFNNESSLFALERNKGLKEIIGTIYNTFDGKDLYSTIEEKASNFLYLIIKNHVFIDGNKRIAATLF